jgi:AraC family transcriptional activator of pobA
MNENKFVPPISAGALNMLLYTENESCFPSHQKTKVQGPYRRYSYYFVFITHGTAEYFIDHKPETAKEGQLLFVVPHQIFFTIKAAEDFRFYKLTLDEECLSLLPNSFSFLTDQLTSPVVSLDGDTQGRSLQLMIMIREMLKLKEISNSLLLSYLNTFFMEIENSYVSREKRAVYSQPDLYMFLAFKTFVETEFRNNISTTDLAKKMNVTADSLNKTVKKFAGISPKEFILRRILLEAKRNLFYDNIPVKELAYSLGFSDPNYFSRLFRKKEKLSVSEYIENMRNLSRKTQQL